MLIVRHVSAYSRSWYWYYPGFDLNKENEDNDYSTSHWLHPTNYELPPILEIIAYNSFTIQKLHCHTGPLLCTINLLFNNFTATQVHYCVLFIYCSRTSLPSRPMVINVSMKLHNWAVLCSDNTSFGQRH